MSAAKCELSEGRGEVSAENNGEESPVHDARAATNALNALASTGPRTTAGKAKSSRNATRHGLTSKLLLAPGEAARDFDEFSSAMSASLAPVGQLEVELVNRAVVSAWRLRRVARLEASYALMQCEHSNRSQERDGGNEGLSSQAVEGATVANRAKVLVTLTRYEAAIERSMYRALHELERVQASRAGQSVPLPMTIDVDVSERG